MNKQTNPNTTTTEPIVKPVRRLPQGPSDIADDFVEDLRKRDAEKSEAGQTARRK